VPAETVESAGLPVAATPAPGQLGQPAAVPIGAYPRVGPLRSNRDFVIVLLGQGISSLGDAVTFTALPLLVLALTGSGVQMGIVGVLSTLPDLFFGLPAGALADRIDRRRLMIVADGARALLVAMIPLSVVLGQPTMGVILLVTFPINVFRVLFMAGWTGAVPNLVDRRQLGAAVSAVEALVALSFIVGPALAGILVGLIGPAETLAIDAASFALAAVTLTWIRRPFQADRSVPRAGFVIEIREGLTFIGTHRVLRLAVGIWTGVGIVMAGIVAALTFAVTRDRGMSAADLGFILSLYGAGNLIGALVGGRLTHGRLAPRFLGGYIVEGVAIVAIGLTLELPLGALLVAALVGGLGSGLTVVAYLTYRAGVTPDRLLSRVGSSARTISTGLQPIGMFATGVLLDSIGGNLTIMLIGVGVLLLAVLFALSPTLRAARGDEHPLEASRAST
jgi:MFS transporter, ENTS family, enterobactin (siderophore) exporter